MGNELRLLVLKCKFHSLPPDPRPLFTQCRSPLSLALLPSAFIGRVALGLCLVSSRPSLCCFVSGPTRFRASGWSCSRSTLCVSAAGLGLLTIEHCQRTTPITKKNGQEVVHEQFTPNLPRHRSIRSAWFLIRVQAENVPIVMAAPEML